MGAIATIRGVYACIGSAIIACATLIPTAASSDDVADFYKGKRLTIFVGSSAGDGTALLFLFALPSPDFLSMDSDNAMKR